jgi:hypothetical protein
VDLEAPDHTTISRRSQQVDVSLRFAATKGRLHLIVDSTGLSMIGEGEWAAVKHGGRGRRAWKKLHLGVDRSGAIVAEVLTEGDAPISSMRSITLQASRQECERFLHDSRDMMPKGAELAEAPQTVEGPVGPVDGRADHAEFDESG